MNFVTNNINSVEQSVRALATEEVKQEKEKVSIAKFPKEMMGVIFDYLTAKELGRASQVSKEWSRLTDVLWREFSLQKVYGWSQVINKKVWQRYGVEVIGGEDAPLGKTRADIIQLVQRLDGLAAQVERNAGLTLLTIPEGLTFNRLVEIEAANGAPETYLWNIVTHKIGEVPVDRTDTIVITNSVLNKSRSKTFAQQQKIVNDLGCRMLKVSEATALNVVTYMNCLEENRVPLPSRLFTQTYTRCSVECVVVGRNPFSYRLNVDYVKCYDPNYIGVAACGSSEAFGL